MTRLLLVELRRFYARRLVRVLGVVAVLGAVGVVAILAAKSSTDVAGSKAAADRMLAQQVAECRAAMGANPAPPPGAPAEDPCPFKETVTAPDGTTQEVNPFFQDPRFHFAQHGKDLVLASAFIWVMLAVALGASAVGAEWQAGTMADLLTWEPRRLRVLAAKFAGATAGVVSLAAVTTGVLVGGAALAAGTRGTLEGTTTTYVGRLLASGGRELAVVALFTLVGTSLAMMTRHTAGAIGVAAAYAILGEVVCGVIVNRAWHNHLLGAHLIAFVQGRYHYYVEPPRWFRDGDSWNPNRYLHAGGAGVLFCIVAGVLVALAAGLFHRRDVT